MICNNRNIIPRMYGNVFDYDTNPSQGSNNSMMMAANGMLPLYGDDPAHQAIPSEDDSFWAQLWYDLRSNPLIFAPGIGPIAQGVWNAIDAGTSNNSTPGPISQYFAENPQVKQQVKDIINSVPDILSQVTSLVPNTLSTTNTLIKYLPYILGILAIVAVVFLFKNPGVVKR